MTAPLTAPTQGAVQRRSKCPALDSQPFNPFNSTATAGPACSGNQKILRPNTPCPEKNLQSSVNNFNKVKRLFNIFGTHYPDATYY